MTISASPPNGTSPLQTTISATATGGTAPYSYSWVLGDGSTATGANVSHLYNQTGLYDAVVYASDAAGHAGMAVDPIAVTPITTGGGGGGGGDGGGGDTRPLTATPSAATLTVRPLVSPAGGAPPLSVQAIASIQNGTGTNESVTWNFGDGGTATGLVASHTYATTGAFTVTATATDSGGNSGTGTTGVTVGGPALTVVLNQTAGDTPVAVLAGVTLVGGSGTWGAATWQWGDGTTSTGMLVAHTYALNLSGPMTIHATARDAGGNTVTGSATVVLTGPPNATLSVTMPANNSLPAVVGFTLNVTGGTGGYATEVLWNFGDQTSTRAPPQVTHSYNTTGHYQVVVETNDSTGHFALASAWVNISSSPQGRGPVGLPPLTGGGSGWVLSGVSDPAGASFILLGMVAVTGLAFLARKQRRKPTVARPSAVSPARRTAPAKAPTRAPPGG